MDDNLTSPGLLWGIWDRAGIVTAAVARMLTDVLAERNIRSQMLRLETPNQFAAKPHFQPLALAVWVVVDEAELADIYQGIASVREKSIQTVCLCMVDSVSSDVEPLLAEAGAQLILRDLAAIPPLLSRLVVHARLSKQGLHPLTSGLVAGLPWGE